MPIDSKPIYSHRSNLSEHKMYEEQSISGWMSTKKEWMNTWTAKDIIVVPSKSIGRGQN